jgi:UDP-2,3-diacylglucosamine pyrophosphatase LpxH
MLVIISDLHLNDGTTGKTVSTDAFVRFRGRLQELAYYASYRHDSPGSYKPLERLDLVLLGDVLDVIRSTQWSAEKDTHPDYARPWFNLEDDGQRARLARKVDQISDDILAKNKDALKQLQRLSGEKPLTLPPATAKGVPASNVKRQPVETRIHYLVGNHDWFWVINKPEFQAIRQKITAALGLVNPPGPFPHDPADSDLLSETYAQHSVFARHGDIFDSFNFDKEKGRAAASLGDAIVIDLMNQFPHEVRGHLKGDIDKTPGLAGFLDGMDELVNVRPLLLAPAWIQGLLRRYEIPKATANKVKEIWNDVADKALEEPYVQEQDGWSPFDTVDLLETTLRFTKALSFHSLSELLSWIQSKIWGGDASFAKHALEEQAFLEQQAKYFIYGHTHHYETVPLYTGMKNGKPFDQMYFNSGTWHPLHELTRHKPSEQNFIEYKAFTYLTFYKDNERKGRQYETWSGTLDS